MNDEIASPGLSAFLDQIGFPASARDRVIAIDRELARKLASDHPDADGCADLVLEAADLIADLDPAGFDWRDCEDEDDPGDADGFDLDNMEWGKE